MGEWKVKTRDPWDTAGPGSVPVTAFANEKHKERHRRALEAYLREVRGEAPPRRPGKPSAAKRRLREARSSA